MNDLLPSKCFLSQNYPNPFSERTTIKFCVAYRTRVVLRVFNFEGRLVKTLLDEEKEAGTYAIEFDARGAHRLSEGVYVYQLQAGGFSETKQMMVICTP